MDELLCGTCYWVVVEGFRGMEVWREFSGTQKEIEKTVRTGGKSLGNHSLLAHMDGLFVATTMEVIG